MAVVGIQPFISVHDSNGDPIVGAKLYVYEVNTTTERAIYSDAGLTTPMDNPLEGANASDAAGNFPVFYMAEGEYKLRAVTSADALIWEEDDLDTGMSAGSGALPIARGGTGATTAAGARANLDVPSNSELDDLSDQIADFTAALQNIINVPGGRLTPTSATPVITTGVTAGTALYYTPYISDLCPIYDGTQFNLRQFAELTMTLVANHTASSIYDLFIINDSGTIRIVSGPGWSNASAGSGSRGTGAGTTELTKLHGLWVNANAMATARNGSSTYNVEANRGTYVGSIFMDGTNGQISCLTAFGQSRKWSIWNAYNRRPIWLQVGDSTASWTSAPTTWRVSRNTAGNSLTTFTGLPEETVDLRFSQTVDCLASGSDSVANIGIGQNSSTATIGKNGAHRNNDGGGSTSRADMVASALLLPTIGINTINALEQAPSGTTNNTFYGTEASMRLTAEWAG